MLDASGRGGSRRIAGVDGCKGGWVAVLRDLDAPGEFSVRRIARLAELLDGPDAPARIAVDIPIGLPERVSGGRAPERAAKALLGPRRSSVFPIPGRAAVYAPDYAEACRRAREASDPPRAPSIQAFHIFPKIREADLLLRERPEWADRLIESHPELIFARIKGEPAEQPKKRRGRVGPEGVAERRALLLSAGLPPALVASAPPKGVGLDDLIDAIACSWTAERALRGEAVPHPDPFERDAFGLPVAIWT